METIISSLITGIVVLGLASIIFRRVTKDIDTLFLVKVSKELCDKTHKNTDDQLAHIEEMVDKLVTYLIVNKQDQHDRKDNEK